MIRLLCLRLYCKDSIPNSQDLTDYKLFLTITIAGYNFYVLAFSAEFMGRSAVERPTVRQVPSPHRPASRSPSPHPTLLSVAAGTAPPGWLPDEPVWFASEVGPCGLTVRCGDSPRLAVGGLFGIAILGLLGAGGSIGFAFEFNVLAKQRGRYILGKRLSILHFTAWCVVRSGKTPQAPKGLNGCVLGCSL